MEYLLLWIVCGFAAAAIYRGKGRSWGVGLVAGFILGPIGIVLAAASSANQEGRERQQLRDGSSKKCPHCSEIIKSDARVCRYCGRDLP